MKSVQEYLDTDLSPDKLISMSTNDLSEMLISAGIVKSEVDIRMIIVEKIQEILKADDEFPITYYLDENDKIPAEHKAVDSGPCLTDDYIANNLQE